jgi:gamma-glutamylcyclotransferase (GGCT)/AIG2-like uncharacterized protein YtfP
MKELIVHGDSSLLLFTYGTLMRGESAHAFVDSLEFIGEACTPVGYRLFDLGDYPGASAGGKARVYGELYRLGPEHIKKLDEYEGHPHLFKRCTFLLDDGQQAFIYVYQKTDTRLDKKIRSGHWRQRHNETHQG